MLKKSILHLWNSPTITSWASIAAKTLSLLIVLPLILIRYTTEEIALWYLFSTLISLQMLADFGFSATFIRSIAYAMGGAKHLSDIGTPSNNGTGPNWHLISQIVATMRWIYIRVGFVVLAVMATLGTVAVNRLISAIPVPGTAWIGWAVIVVISAISLFGNYYSAYLQGANHIALLRRWEAIFSLCAIFTSFLVLLFHGNLLMLICANQIWVILNTLRNKLLCAKIEAGKFQQFDKTTPVKEIFKAIWPPTWRSGIGVLLGYGIFATTGIIYAQFGQVKDVAIYLFAQRLIQTIAMFSQAPFYSKLPYLAKLYAEGESTKLVNMLKTGMLRSHATFVFAFCVAGLMGKPLLSLVKSNIQFPDMPLWTLLGIGFFIERYSAMHLQVYSLTNKIIWHTVTAISGVIFIITAILLFRFVDMLAFPIALIFSYSSFNSWYSAKHSYTVIKENFFKFEAMSSFFPFAILLLYVFFVFLVK